MAIVCILMNRSNISSYKVENAAVSWDLDLGWCVPDNMTILRARADLDMKWLEEMTVATAKACMEQDEADKADAAAVHGGIMRQPRLCKTRHKDLDRNAVVIANWAGTPAPPWRDSSADAYPANWKQNRA